MKYVIIAALAILSYNSIAQQPPKRASKIIVTANDSANTELNRIAKMLFDKGFTIDTKDEATKTISTKEFAPGHPSIFLKVRASINDTTIVFTGTYMFTFTNNLLPTRQEFDAIEYRGMKNSAAMQAWNSFDAIVKTYNSKVTYSK
jgi:hypothetical protein